MGDELPAGVLAILRLVHREKLVLAPAFDLRRGAGNHVEHHAIEIQDEFISGDAFLLRARIRVHERGITNHPRKILLPDQDSLDPLQRAVLDAHPAQDWMRIQTAFLDMGNQVGDRLAVAANEVHFPFLLDCHQH